jgi:hypothetical protein
LSFQVAYEELRHLDRPFDILISLSRESRTDYRDLQDAVSRAEGRSDPAGRPVEFVAKSNSQGIVSVISKASFAVKKKPSCLRSGNELAKNTYWGVVAETPAGGFGMGGELRSP